MKPEKNPIELVFECSLRNAGFTKKSNCWYRGNPEVLEVAHLQRSRFGPQYYVNYALWLIALGEPNMPKENQCHIRLREDEFGADRNEVRELFDLSSAIGEQERERRLSFFFSNFFIPLSNQCRSLSQIRTLYRERRFSNAMVLAEADRLLVHTREHSM